MKPRYTILEAADLLGLSRSKLYARIGEGRITVIKDGAETFISHDEVMRYAGTAQPPVAAYTQSHRARPAKTRAAG